MRLLFFDTCLTKIPNSFFDVAVEYEIVVLANVRYHDQIIKSMNDNNFRFERVPEMVNEGGTLIFVPKSWGSVSKKYGVFTKTKEDAWWTSVTVRNGEAVYQIIGCQLEVQSLNLRLQQFRELSNIREKESKSVIACNSHILYYQEERFAPPDGFIDAWICTGNMKNQFTRSESRQDRVWFSGMNCSSYEIIDFRRNNTGVGVELI